MIGADPAELDVAARLGPGQAWSLTNAARTLERLDGVRLRHGGRHLAVVAEVADGLRRLGAGAVELDAWVQHVAAALRAADTTSPVLPLLRLGVAHPATRLVSDGAVRWRDLRPDLLTDGELTDLAAIEPLPTRVRDRVERERLGRWVDDVAGRIATVPDDGGRSPLDRLATWVDDHLVDRLSTVVDLHRSHEERTEQLRAEVQGARRLLAHTGMTFSSFDPAGPSLRVTLGDLDGAATVAVLLPGTGTGLHAVDEPLADATALHDSTADAAVVLDLYPAPPDLGRAADPSHGRAAGDATAAFLATLPTTGRRTTLVGHSYGAFTAALAAIAARPGTVDALVLLGAPGAGVATAADLPVREVWADRAPGDPIAAVADLDEHVRRLPPQWVPGPLADPLAALGPDPTDPEFGARRLADLAADGEVHRGHLDYLTPGSATLARVAAVVTAPPPTRDRPGSAAGG